jgi:hypothetical protein
MGQAQSRARSTVRRRPAPRNTREGDRKTSSRAEPAASSSTATRTRPPSRDHGVDDLLIKLASRRYLASNENELTSVHDNEVLDNVSARPKPPSPRGSSAWAS